MSRAGRDWRGTTVDAGIVAFFAALPATVLTGSSWVGLGLLAVFMLATGPSMFLRRRR